MAISKNKHRGSRRSHFEGNSGQVEGEKSKELGVKLKGQFRWKRRGS